MKKHVESICNYLDFPAEATACFCDAWNKNSSLTGNFSRPIPASQQKNRQLS